jgi:hypothetical protein
LAVSYSADDVVAELGLRIEHGGGRQRPAIGHIEQFGDDRGRADIDCYPEYLLLRITRPVLSVNIGPNLDLGGDAVLQYFLLKESRFERDCDGKVRLDMVLTGQDFAALGLELDEAFSARSGSAANTVQDNTGLARGLDKRYT